MTDLPPNSTPDAGVSRRIDYPGIPRWVKIAGIVVASLVLLALVVVITGIGGPHGPGRHLPSADAAGRTSPSIPVEEPTTPGLGNPATSGVGSGGQPPPSGGY